MTANLTRMKEQENKAKKKEEEARKKKEEEEKKKEDEDEEEYADVESDHHGRIYVDYRLPRPNAFP